MSLSLKNHNVEAVDLSLLTSTLSIFLLSISILKFISGLLLCLFLNIMKLVLSMFRDGLFNSNQFDIVQGLCGRTNICVVSKYYEIRIWR